MGTEFHVDVMIEKNIIGIDSEKAKQADYKKQYEEVKKALNELKA